ncbi:MAG: hypothetical protein Kow00127_11310 [Bacteroidales bacterium]
MSKEKGWSIKRRDLIKGLATLPVLGVVGGGWLVTEKNKSVKSKETRKLFELSSSNPVFTRRVDQSKKIRLGIIGTGGRGRALLKGAGFLRPEIIDGYIEGAHQNPNDTRYDDFLAQDDLNVEVVALCDIYDLNAERGMRAAANKERKGSSEFAGDMPRRYHTYKELINDPEVDAVIIATPDHWHGTMTIEAARAGKHVYCEKPMTWTVEETYEVRRAVRENGIVFQLGHQNRQIESYHKAEEAYRKGLLGEVHLIEVTTNRNSPTGAWVYPIEKEAGPHNIDWEQFIGPAPDHPFSLERFFRWRCWWDYSTGLSGDLFTHEYDAVNQILHVGIPDSAVSSGGIYHFRDGRTVPDVLQQTFEFSDKGMTLLYSASLASSRMRGRLIMGSDATLELTEGMTIYIDGGSEKYRDWLENGTLKGGEPAYSFVPGLNKADALTSPTEKYFAGRGLLYTYLNGMRVDTTHLHIRDWLNCIRGGGEPQCSIDRGFEEAITAHMGTIAYRENRKVYWDREREVIV